MIYLGAIQIELFLCLKISQEIIEVLFQTVFLNKMKKQNLSQVQVIFLFSFFFMTTGKCDSILTRSLGGFSSILDGADTN